MSNVTNHFRAMFLYAHQCGLDSKFEEADEICYRLLREPTLPLLYRAGCNLFLSFGDESSVEFAKEAVFWYEEMYNEVHDDPVNGPHHLALLEQARDALIRAEREVAEANEQSDDEDEDYDNDDSGDGDDVDGEDNNNNDEDNEYQDDRDGEQDVGNRVQMVLANNIETGPASSQQASMV